MAEALVAAGVQRAAVVDLSGAALASAQARLGPLATSVTWIEADVTTLELPPSSIETRHDRAVFNFLTDASDRVRFVAVAARAVRPGGVVVIGTVARDGPARCSGVLVAQYSAEGLAEVFGAAFRLRHSSGDNHQTPTGAAQQFTSAVLERV